MRWLALADHLGTEGHRDLHREVTDTARGGVHEDPVPGTDLERLGRAHWYAVSPASGRAAASSNVRLAGLRASVRSGAGTSSAAVPHFTSSRRT